MSKFIAFGDSNTEGSNFYTLYPNELDKRWIVRSGAANVAERQSGSTITAAYARFKANCLDLYPTTVSLMFGTVDQTLSATGVPSVSLAVYEDYLNRMVTHLTSRGVKVLLMTSAPFHNTTYHNRMSDEVRARYSEKGGARQWANQYNNIVRKVAAERGTSQNVWLVDHYANAWAKAAPGDGSAGDVELAASGLIDSTGTHWTPKGHDMMLYSINYYLAK